MMLTTLPRHTPSSIRGPVEATVTKISGIWFAKLDHKAQALLIPISREDAWNFDIEKGLGITIAVTPGCCRILKKKGNKRYVRVAHIDASFCRR